MKPLDIGVTATLDGLDVDLRGSGPLGRAETQKLAETAEALDLARVSNHGEIVIERRPPRVAFGDALARLPPGGFLQATEAGEAWLAEFAERALADTKKIADLFCGAGAFALEACPLAMRSSPPTPTRPRLPRSPAPPRRRRACVRLLRRRAISSAARCEPTSSLHSTRRSSIRRAPARSNRPARSLPQLCRSLSPSRAMRRPSPATRAFSSTAAFSLSR